MGQAQLSGSVSIPGQFLIRREKHAPRQESDAHWHQRQPSSDTWKLGGHQAGPSAPSYRRYSHGRSLPKLHSHPKTDHVCAIRGAKARLYQ